MASAVVSEVIEPSGTRICDVENGLTRRFMLRVLTVTWVLARSSWAENLCPSLAAPLHVHPLCGILMWSCTADCVCECVCAQLVSVCWQVVLHFHTVKLWFHCNPSRDSMEVSPGLSVDKLHSPYHDVQGLDQGPIMAFWTAFTVCASQVYDSIWFFFCHIRIFTYLLILLRCISPTSGLIFLQFSLLTNSAFYKHIFITTSSVNLLCSLCLIFYISALPLYLKYI